MDVQELATEVKNAGRATVDEVNEVLMPLVEIGPFPSLDDFYGVLPYSKALLSLVVEPLRSGDIEPLKTLVQEWVQEEQERRREILC